MTQERTVQCCGLPLQKPSTEGVSPVISLNVLRLQYTYPYVSGMCLLATVLQCATGKQGEPIGRLQKGRWLIIWKRFEKRGDIGQLPCRQESVRLK